MDADTFVQVAICYRWYIHFLGSNACGHDNVFRYCCMLTSRSLELHDPPLCRWIILCPLNLCRGDHVEIESLDISLYLGSQIIFRQTVGRQKLLVIVWFGFISVTLGRILRYEKLTHIGQVAQ